MSQQVQYREPRTVTANGIDIVYDSFGERSNPPMLLVMGLGAQMITWDDEFCKRLASKGYWVIRFDNRDVGLSTRFEEAGIPDISELLQALMQGEPLSAPYYLRDMADDAVGLLDQIGINSAHVIGASMGGMIVQEMAIHHPARLRTMISIMSSTGHPDLPPPKPEAMAVLLTPSPAGRAAYIENAVRSSKILHGSTFAFDEERTRERAGRAFDRGLSPNGTTRQLAAVLASGSRKEALKSTTIPTLVIHGSDDPLVPVEGGIDTAEAIPGAELLIIQGMGHSIPPVLWPQVMKAITNHAA